MDCSCSKTTVLTASSHTPLFSRKVNKYANLGQVYLFMPVAIETLGAFGPKTLAFVKELGRRVRRETGEAKATVGNTEG